MTRLTVPRVLLLVTVVVLVNLPFVHSWWLEQRLDRGGVAVVAEVVGEQQLPPADDPRFWLSYTLPEQIDPEQRTWASEVDAATFTQASRDGTLAVEVIVDDPGVNRAVGRVTRNLGLWLTIFADAALLTLLVLYLVVRRRLRLKQVRMVAVCDLERTKPGYSLEEGENGLWIARGEVVSLDDEEVVLDVGGGQQVTVVLDGNQNPVGHQQTVRAFGRITE